MSQPLFSFQVSGIFCYINQQEGQYHASVEDLVKGDVVEAIKETREAAHRWCFEQLLTFLVVERNNHIPRRFRSQSSDLIFHLAMDGR